MANQFKRKLPEGALEHLRTECAWWQDVLRFRYADDATGTPPRPLLFALRHGYFNLYAEGQSVLKVGFEAPKKGHLQVRCKLHWKYVCGPDAGDGYFDFDGTSVTEGRERRLVQKYAGPETLAGWVAAARDYAGDEKKGVAIIANRHSEIIDVEMALPANDIVAPGDKKVANRMDIVALERHGAGIRLAFYEAKLFSNKELRSEAFKPRVLGQLQRYRSYVSEQARRDQVLTAYENACRIGIEVDAMFGRVPHPLVLEIARGARLDLDPQPRLIVFDIKEGQVGPGTAWEPHEQVLRQAVPLLSGQRASDIQLPVLVG